MFEYLSQDFNVIDESGNAGDSRNGWILELMLCHWISIMFIVLYLNLQSLLTHVNEVDQSGRVFCSCSLFLNRLTVICKTKRNKTKWNKTKGKSVICLEWLKLSFCCENVCVYSLSCVITWQCGIHYITKKGHKRASIRIITKCFPIINMPEPCNNLIKANIIMSCILSGHSPNWIFKEELWNLAIESQI